MKIEVNRELLVKALTKSCGISGKSGKTVLPMLHENLFKVSNSRMEITSTDLENTLVVGLGVKHLDDEKELTFIVDGGIILKIITLLNIENIVIDIEADDNGFGTVTYGEEKRKRKYQIPINYEAHTFPKIPQLEPNNTIKIDSEPLKKILKSCVPLCNPNDLRPAFQGVCVYSDDKHISFSSTNGHAIAHISIENENNEFNSSVLLSKTTCDIVSEYEKDSVVTISFDDKGNKVIFSDGATVLYANLLEGKYPDVNKIISSIDHNSYVQVDKLEFLGSVKRNLVLCNKNTYGIDFNFSKNDVITISAEDLDWSRKSAEEISVVEKAEEVKHNIRLNGNLIVNFLQNIESEKVVICTREKTPILIYPVIENSIFTFKYVLAPIATAEK